MLSKKGFVAFVVFKKAFDSVGHDKLLRLYISAKLFQKYKEMTYETFFQNNWFKSATNLTIFFCDMGITKAWKYRMKSLNGLWEILRKQLSFNQSINLREIKPPTLANSYRYSHQSLNNFFWKFFKRQPPDHVILIPFPQNCCMKTLTFFFHNHQHHHINTSLASGIVSPDLKTAIVKPLLKKPSLDKNVLKNYRTISNLHFLSKVREKVVLHQLLAHPQENNLCNPFQSAYRTGHSTETALLRVVNDLLTAVDEDKISALLLLDLSAAFDTMHHQILLSRLETVFGIRSTALQWFRSYLLDRS